MIGVNVKATVTKIVKNASTMEIVLASVTRNMTAAKLAVIVIVDNIFSKLSRLILSYKRLEEKVMSVRDQLFLILVNIGL